MNLAKIGCLFLTTLSLTVVHGELQAKGALDCSKKSLAAEIAKLNPLVPNAIEITGDCQEDIVVSGHSDLTIFSDGSGSISATLFDPASPFPPDSTIAVSVERSTLTLRDLTLNGGSQAVFCYTDSNCILENVTVAAQWDGVSTNDQARLEIYGSSSISGAVSHGLSIFGNSHVMVRPNPWGAGGSFTDPGPSISGNGTGAFVADNSFFRSDNASFTGNDVGIWAQRDAVIKVFSHPSLPGVSNNSSAGVVIWSTSTGQIGAPINDNGGDGIYVGVLSLGQNAGSTFSNNGTDIACQDDTSKLKGFGPCP